MSNDLDLARIQREERNSAFRVVGRLEAIHGQLEACRTMIDTRVCPAGREFLEEAIRFANKALLKVWEQAND